MFDPKQLKARLAQAKLANVEKAFHFAFIPGNEESVLLVTKAKIRASDVQKAKSDTASTKCYVGSCFGENALLVFSLAKKPPSMLELLMTRFLIKAGIRMKLEVRWANEGKKNDEKETKESEGSDEDELATDDEISNDDIDEEIKSEKKEVKEEDKEKEYLAEIGNRLKDLGPKLKLLLQQEGRKYQIGAMETHKSEDPDRARELFWEINAKIKRKKFQDAGSLLDELEPVVLRSWHQATPKGLDDQEKRKSAFKDLDPLLASAIDLQETKEPTKEEQKKGYARLYKEHQSRLNVMLEDLRTHKHELPDTIKKKAVTALKEAEVALDSDDPEKIRKALGRLEGVMETVESALDRSAWNRRIDLSSCKKGEYIDAGSWGEVSRLVSKNSDAPRLVIKIFKDHGNAGKHDGTDMKGHEEKMYQVLGDHPNIVRCCGIHKVGKDTGLVMEEMSGTVTNAREKLRQQVKSGKIKESDFWGVMQYSLLSMVKGLQHMHANGYAHLDLKPDNVMFDAETGAVKLTDMGTVRKHGEQVEFFSPGWIDINVYEHEKGTRGSSKTSPEVDAYTVGATAFDLEEGQEVTEQFTTKKLERDHAEWLKTKCGDFLKRLMDPDQKKRMTLEQALEHPFLKDRLLNDENAREVIKGLKTSPNQSVVPQEVSKTLGKAIEDLPIKRDEMDAGQIVAIESYRMWIAGLSAYFERIARLKDSLPEFEKCKYDISAYERYSTIFSTDESALSGFKERLPNLGKEAADRFTKLEKTLTNTEDVAKARADVKKVLENLTTASKDIPKLLEKLEAARKRISLVLASPGAAALRKLPAILDDVVKLNSLLSGFGSGTKVRVAVLFDYETTFTSAKDRLSKASNELAKAVEEMDDLKKDKTQGAILLSVEEGKKKVDAALLRLGKALDALPKLANEAGYWIEKPIQQFAAILKEAAALLDGKEKVSDLSADKCVKQYVVVGKWLVECNKHLNELVRATDELGDALRLKLDDDHVLLKRTKLVTEKKLAAKELQGRLEDRLEAIRGSKGGLEAGASLALKGTIYTKDECERNGKAREQQIESWQFELTKLSSLDQKKLGALHRRLVQACKKAAADASSATEIHKVLFTKKPGMLSGSAAKTQYNELLERMTKEIKETRSHSDALDGLEKFVAGELQSKKN